MNPTADPSREFALQVVKRLRAAGFQSLWAGGCVRDLLRGRRPKDYDVATDARPEQVQQLFGRNRTLAVGASFGVILVRAPRTDAGGASIQDVEVATFRTEGPYRDGRRPDSVEFSSPEEDAKRRDFTINGMFFDPLENRVLDYVGGERDLADQLVRAIGDPHARMKEDKLRLLRAIRFTATMNFQLDPATANAVRDLAGEIVVVSAERIAQELKRMLVDENRRQAIELVADLNLLPMIFPELEQLRLGRVDDPQGWFRTLRMLGLLQSPTFELAAATLLHAAGRDGPDPSARSEGDEVAAICRRLRLSNEETELIRWLAATQDDPETLPEWPVARQKRLLALPHFDQLLALSRAKLLAMERSLAPILWCESYLQSTPRTEIDPPPLLTGADLIALGLKPGPNFKTWLDAIRDRQLEGEISNREAALAYAAELRETTSAG